MTTLIILPVTIMTFFGVKPFKNFSTVGCVNTFSSSSLFEIFFKTVISALLLPLI